MGRLENYATALDKGDDEMLAQALARNLLRTPESMDQALQSGLVGFVRNLAEKIDSVSEQDLLQGRMNIEP